MAPMALNMIEEKEKRPAPQSPGMYPPIVPPMNMNIQMRDFDDMLKVYQKKKH